MQWGTGTVIDIIYNSDNDAPGVPACVIVNFGKAYKGPHFSKKSPVLVKGLYLYSQKGRNVGRQLMEIRRRPIHVLLSHCD